MSRLLRGLAALAVAVAFSLPTAVADDGAMPSVVPTDASPEVMEVVQGVEATYKDVETLQAHFEQTVTAMGMERKDTGEVLLSRPRKMRWDFAGEDGSLFVTDGNFMWVYTRATKTAIKYQDLGEAASSVAPIDLQDLESLRDKFTVVLAPESGRKSNLVLILTPRAEIKMPFKQVTLELSSKYVLQTITVVDTLDNLTELQFTKVRFNPDVPATSFSFDPPPGVEVIEAGAL